jgi:hypothetical protein
MLMLPPFFYSSRRAPCPNIALLILLLVRELFEDGEYAYDFY